MSDIPEAAIDAARNAIANIRDRGATSIDLARAALEAAEAVWPHDPPKRDPASVTSGEFGRGPQQRPFRRGSAPPRREVPFGFGPPEVTA